MSVGLLLNNWGTWGGAATYHTALIEGLQRRGINVRIALPFKKETWEVPRDIPFFVGPSQSVKAMQASSTWIVWGIGHKASLSYYIRRKKTRPKVIVINHGSADNKWSCSCMAREAPYADVVVGVSKDSVGAIPIEHRSKSVVISGPVDRARLIPVSPAKEMRKHLGLTDENRVLLYFGRISKEKRVDLAIEAMRYMPENWRLLIVGGASSDLDPKPLYNNFKVQFCGPTSTPGDYLQLADCTISPSALEGFGLSVAEAIIYGVPTVAHRVGFLQEHSVGTVIPIDSSPQHFAAAVIKASGEKQKAEQDKLTLSSMFTVESFIEQWSAIL